MRSLVRETKHRDVHDQTRLLGQGNWMGVPTHWRNTAGCTLRKGLHQVIDRILGLNLTPRVTHEWVKLIFLLHTCLSAFALYTRSSIVI